MVSENPYLVFSGSKSQYLTEQICKSLGCSMGRMTTQHFADGEFAVSYEESIRGRDVFLVQSTFPSADNLMELLLMIDAAKRASAHYITAVVPYFGWARQDRKDKPRVSIGAKLIADLLSTAGITRLITMERGRHRPTDYDGSPCRSDTRILRCTRRSPLCFVCLYGLYRKDDASRQPRSRYSRRWGN